MSTETREFNVSVRDPSTGQELHDAVPVTAEAVLFANPMAVVEQDPIHGIVRVTVPPPVVYVSCLVGQIPGPNGEVNIPIGFFGTLERAKAEVPEGLSGRWYQYANEWRLDVSPGHHYRITEHVVR